MAAINGMVEEARRLIEGGANVEDPEDPVATLLSSPTDTPFPAPHTLSIHALAPIDRS